MGLACVTVKAVQMYGCSQKALQDVLMALLPKQVSWSPAYSGIEGPERSTCFCKLFLLFVQFALGIYTMWYCPPVVVFAVDFCFLECFVAYAYIVFKFNRNQRKSLQSASLNLFFFNSFSLFRRISLILDNMWSILSFL